MTRRAPEDLGEWAKLYREARSPSASLRATVEGEIRDGQNAEHEFAELTASTTGSQWGLGLALGGLLGAAALLGLTCSLDAFRGREAVDAALDITPMQRVPSSEAKANAASGQPVPPAASVSPSPTQGPTAAVAQAPGPNDAALRPRGRVQEPPHDTSGNRDLESLRALRVAERTLRSDPTRARLLLEQHTKNYPNSKVWLEREALWIRAACRSGGGGVKGLNTRRASFSRRADVGAYRTAIERDCASKKESTP